MCVVITNMDFANLGNHVENIMRRKYVKVNLEKLVSVHLDILKSADTSETLEDASLVSGVILDTLRISKALIILKSVL